MDIDTIITGLAREGGGFGIVFNMERGKWFTSLEFGREAEDSPMAGGAAYGVSATAEEAIRQIVEQTGWDRRVEAAQGGQGDG